MSTVQEIEAAIEALPPAEVETLAAWLAERRDRLVREQAGREWLRWAVGAAKPGVATDEILRLTRGEE